MFNPTRIEYILDVCSKHFGLDLNKIAPLKYKDFRYWLWRRIN